MLDSFAHRLLFRYSNLSYLKTNGSINISSENPTPKFGEALRDQVEERLNFFEHGIAPSKNADAIRKVLDQLAHEDGDDDEENDMDVDGPALTTLEAEPKKEKKKKRKSSAMDVDGEEEDEEPSSKKVKLSKEEKKALKKAKKEQAKSEVAAEEVSLL